MITRNPMFAAAMMTISVAACATNGGLEDEAVNDASAFDGDCGATTSSCGQLSARWKIENREQSTTCDAVGATNVTLRATFQADGRVATFTNACGTGAILTPKLPLGPYTLQLSLVDGSGAVLGTETATTTLGLAGSVSEASVEFDIAIAPRAGELYGACAAGGACANGMTCISFAGSQTCAPACTQLADPVCAAAAAQIGGDAFWMRCTPVDINTLSNRKCLQTCDGDAPPCPSGLTCRTHEILGPYCVH